MFLFWNNAQNAEMDEKKIIVEVKVSWVKLWLLGAMTFAAGYWLGKFGDDTWWRISWTLFHLGW